MEERAWKVTLADGTSLGSLKLNGNNFISTTEVTKEMFEDNLTEVTIEGCDSIEKHGTGADQQDGRRVVVHPAGYSGRGAGADGSEGAAGLSEHDG